MNINEALITFSESDVIIGMDSEGTVKLIKNGHSGNEVRCLSDAFDVLWRLFNQETNIEYFNEAFHQEFNDLLLKHFKRTKFEKRQVVSIGQELWASTG
jgi:hypothetical protein